jgi:hypothetical protein
VDDPKPLCPSCARNVVRKATWPDKPGGLPKLREYAACEVHVVAFPKATSCFSYVREAGAD